MESKYYNILSSYNILYVRRQKSSLPDLNIGERFGNVISRFRDTAKLHKFWSVKTSFLHLQLGNIRDIRILRPGTTQSLSILFPIDSISRDTLELERNRIFQSHRFDGRKRYGGEMEREREKKREKRERESDRPLNPHPRNNF